MTPETRTEQVEQRAKDRTEAVVERLPAQKRVAAGSLTALSVVLAGVLVNLACLVLPIYVIRPFRPQEPSQLAVALTVRTLAPWLTAVVALVALLVVFRAWKRPIRLWARIALASLTTIAVAATCLTHVNIFEIMFHPYDMPAFASASSVQVDADEMVLAVRIGTEAHAYPVRTMGYHHIVNDTVGGVPIAATYCTLCHTGLVWSRTLDGRTLYFHLAGINNGNALMRDEQTSSIWQQSTGQAIFGPLKGRQLGLIHSDELTFATWHKEQSQGLVLKPDAQYASRYDDKDWEKEVEKTRTVVDTRKSGIPPHELMLGITIDGHSKAYPIKAILAAKIIQDEIADVPILIVVGPDHASIRVFEVGSADQPMNFVPAKIADGKNSKEMDGIVEDAETGSVWNFQGCAIDGKLAGRCLKTLDANKDYWFDWMNHHPASAVFQS